MAAVAKRTEADGDNSRRRPASASRGEPNKHLEEAETRLYRAERSAGAEHETTAAQRRADALGLWLEERAHPRAQLVVHSFEGGEHPRRERESPALLVTEEGSRVSAETSSRLVCDAEIVPIRRAGDGSVLDVGRRRRTVGWRMRKALDARDGGCRLPGCESRARTHAHHIIPWAGGGETAMNNLVLLCPLHHRAVHEGGWRVEMDEWGRPRFFNPLGVPVPAVPASPDLGGIESRDAGHFGLARWHGQDGIDAWSSAPAAVAGERIDWDWALACNASWRDVRASRCSDRPGPART